MLRWLADKIVELVSLVPPWLVEKDTLHFVLVRGLFAILFVILAIVVIAFWPSRAVIAQFIGKMFLRKSR
jgi:hypothetical protein